MRRLGTVLGVSAACLAIVAGCAGTATSGSSARPGQDAATSVSPVVAASTANHDLLADLDIGGGRTMHLLCVGPIDSGKPTVIFESGLTGDAGQWSDVFHELDGSVRACAYDRAGDGQSPPADAPAGRTTADQLADLRALLDVADVAAALRARRLLRRRMERAGPRGALLGRRRRCRPRGRPPTGRERALGRGDAARDPRRVRGDPPDADGSGDLREGSDAATRKGS